MKLPTCRLHINLPVDIPFDRLFGGAVRDTIRGVKPADYDFLFFSEAKFKRAIECLHGFKCTSLSIDEERITRLAMKAVRAKCGSVQYDLFLCRNSKDIDIAIMLMVEITANCVSVDENNLLHVDEKSYDDIKNHIMRPTRAGPFLLGRAFHLKQRGLQPSMEMIESLIDWLLQIEKQPSSSLGYKYVSIDSYSSSASPKHRTISNDMLYVIGAKHIPLFMLHHENRVLLVGKAMWNIVHGYTFTGKLLKLLCLWKLVAKSNGWSEYQQ